MPTFVFAGKNFACLVVLRPEMAFFRRNGLMLDFAPEFGTSAYVSHVLARSRAQYETSKSSVLSSRNFR